MIADFKGEFTFKKFEERGKEAEFDKLYDEAVQKVKANVLGKKHPIYIDGHEIITKEQIMQYSPIDKTLMGSFQKADRDITRKAIDAAFNAFQSWSNLDYRERAAIFEKAAHIFSERKFELAAILSIENGKSRYESIGEVDEAIDFLRYYSIELLKNKRYIRKTALPGSKAKVEEGFQGAPERSETGKILLRPYGVFGVIAPFNFPLSISVGMSSGALITGNAVVFKPSSTDNMTMLTGLEIYKIFKDAGVPHGVFNYVTGPGSEVGDELVVNPKVSGIVFTGSRSTGLSMIKKTYDMGQHKAFVVEMGGKNPTIVSKYANLDHAVQGITAAAFGYCGQKCSCTSRIYVHESIKEEFISKLVDRVRNLKIGDPTKKENYIGPVISDVALNRYKKVVEEAKRSARIIYGGSQVNAGNGSYVQPTIIEAKHDTVFFRDEFFLPILAVDTYTKFEDAIMMANETEYGLTAGLYSEKKAEITEFFNKIQAGVVYVNREGSATTGAVVGVQTFVGWKNSGLTGKGTGSKFYLQQFMREQSQTTVK